MKFPGQEFVLELAQGPAQSGPSPIFQHLGVDVTDIEAAAERALAAGARNFSGVRTVRATGGVVAMNAFFLGPDGESLELMQSAGKFRSHNSEIFADAVYGMLVYSMVILSTSKDKDQATEDLMRLIESFLQGAA